MTRRRRHDRRTLSSTLSARVLEYLREHNFSQAEVARILGVSESFISLVKSRERSLTLDHLESLALALKVPLGAFMVGVTTPKGGETEYSRACAHLIEMADQVIQSIREAAPETAPRTRAAG
jgi:transcriptional regulator with XRE-family HTH domain